MSEGTHAQPLRPLPSRGGGAARFFADRQALVAWGGGALALLIGVLLFTRFSIEGNLWRDEAIYAYGGQQLADGVPVYQGIFDPKPPLPTFLTAIGVIGGRVLGEDRLLTLRAECFVFALLAVVGVYWLGLCCCRAQ